VGDLLVLWDVDYTLLSAGGLGNSLYEAVFKDLFGRDLTAIAPKAGRTDRAILLDTLALAGVAEPRAHVDDFMVLLGRRASAMDGSVQACVRALPGAAAAISALAAAGVRQSVLTGNIRPLAAAKLTAAEKRISVNAAQALGLGIAGVDLLRSKRGPLVLEVNASPGLEGIEAASGVNVSEKIIKHLEQSVGKAGR